MAVSAVAFPAALLSPMGRRADALVLLGCGGRELAWQLVQLVAARPVIQLLHGGARGADQAIGLAAEQLG